MSTRKAAVVGAGQTGATVALGLLDAGFDVTVYSERAQQELRDAVPPTGTALIFGDALNAERALGLDTFGDRAPHHEGLHARLVAPDGSELLEFDSPFSDFWGVAVDTRLKADERLTVFQERGGRFVVDAVTPASLDGIAAANDLTLVATGRSGLSELFPVDPTRSPYDRPQRSVISVAARGLGFGPEVFGHRGGGTHSAFTVVSNEGEGWWGPFLHKDAGPVWSFLGWARPGSEFERRFATADSAASALRVVQDLYRDHAEWDLPEVLALEPIEEDPKSWLRGAVRPVVREGVAVTSGGHPVAAIGDAAAAYDPIGGQGAQAGLLYARLLVDAATEHTGEFDADWIRRQYSRHLAERSDQANRFTRIFLGDPEFADIANVLFVAAAVSPVFASTVTDIIKTPNLIENVRSERDALAFVSDVTGTDAGELLAGFAPAGRFTRSNYPIASPVS
ncbi:styrene monooxygenase/indole monooxygenase family protein [Microbacterium sp. SORGH_AS_0888]|uniref:styrene monooxygenase/indole monooxygenase family protein n=1 Tax=Microbacterium sp. SORGH_AS_0888 TaxID=3041791 RepID=UPI0027892FAC|nr:styrene monooxygenase/indole monooxygenase family protein [Microbacterium sp. SORGH_AS_0888]MDQ1128269.1 2-polyprenyl-6-methoxyphenol hydroxylase-like FAD-dependent oxidoreductase [Microbacterium sp. SORGH_AS_0888]